ncbi:MAG TPA: hypothetical protein VH475_06935 [Tepidisphaeraceae bacterium]|jgi:hypothetical protein
MTQQSPLQQQQGAADNPTHPDYRAQALTPDREPHPETVAEDVLEQMRDAAAATASDGTGISGNVDATVARQPIPDEEH